MSQNPKVFLVRAGQSGEDEDRVLEGNIAILGYLEVPSLASATTTKASEKSLNGLSQTRSQGQ